MATTSRAALEALLQARQLDRTLVAPAGRLSWTTVETAPTGIPAIDRHLGGGFPLGQFSEIVGPRSSGRTSVLVALLAATTRRDERVALVDTFDTFDPESAAAAGLDLSRVLWIRGDGSTAAFPFLNNRQNLTERALERALKATNLLLQSGGFGVVALDLGDAPPHAVRHVPLSTWKRLQRVLDGQQTVGMVLGNTPMSRSAGGVSLVLQPIVSDHHAAGQWGLTNPSHLFQGLATDIRVLRVQRVSGEEGRPLRVTAAARVA